VTTTHAERLPLLTRRDRIMITITVVAAVAAGVLHFAHVNAVLAFIVSALSLATLASLVGRSVEALGDRVGPNATGILQTALGNLPELFVILFALRAGLYGVVKATIVGSILSNALLVLGLAFVVGGIKHGRQRFAADDGRTLGLMFTLAVFILAVPSLTAAVHTPAESHERAVSVVVSVVMLALFALSLPATLGNRAPDPVAHAGHDATSCRPLPPRHVRERRGRAAPERRPDRRRRHGIRRPRGPGQHRRPHAEHRQRGGKRGAVHERVCERSAVLAGASRHVDRTLSGALRRGWIWW